MDQKKPIHSTQQSSPHPPVDTQVPHVDPYAPYGRFIPKKLAITLLLTISFGIITFAVLLARSSL